MIGNDVVDLEFAKKESNWQRKGFLDKIFTKNEQFLIQKSKNQDITLWCLWSRKEAAYKIWNRETGIRKFNPIQFECFDLESEIGKVKFKNTIYFTKTQILIDYIHTIAVLNKEIFNNIKFIKKIIIIERKKGIPFYINENQEIKPVSKSHHGRFESIITIN